MHRYGDVGTFDTTHNMTRYEYKLATIIVVDSESKPRCALFALMLNETVDDFAKFLECWHEASKNPIPIDIITYGDEALAAAITSVLLSIQVHHPLCAYHLFDRNIKNMCCHTLQSLVKA